MDKKSFDLYTNNHKMVAKEIADVIKVIISRLSPEGQHKSITNIKSKIDKLSPMEISSKKSPGGATIGTSISIIKNILNGRDAVFVKMVLDEVKKEL